MRHYKKSPVSIPDQILSQAARSLPPTQQDYEETFNMFDDFCIPQPTRLPVFNTYAELEHYRTSYIRQCLRTNTYTSKAFRKEYEYDPSKHPSRHSNFFKNKQPNTSQEAQP